MRTIVLVALTLTIAEPVLAQTADFKDGYARGFREGYDEGYRKAQDELRGRGVAPPPPAAGSFPIVVSLATYGPERGNSCDATGYVARRANGKRSVNVDVNNSMCGDPAPGKRKSLEITYICGNTPKTASGYEHRSVYLSCLD